MRQSTGRFSGSMVIAKAARILANRMLVDAPRHEQIDQLGEGRQDVYEAEPRHGPANVKIGQYRIEERD